MYPILFEFGFITVYSLWFFVAIGFVVGALTFANLTKRHRVKPDLITDNSLLLLLFSVVLSRIFFVLSNSGLYFYSFGVKQFFLLFALWDKGLSFWGAIFGLALGLGYIAWRKRKPVLKLIDYLSPSILIGVTIGSIGAFFDGVNYGTPTELPWGVAFRSANVKFISAIHPTQIYGMIYSLGLALLAIYILKKFRNQNHDGFVTELSVFLFAAFRFLEEFLRGDDIIAILGIRYPFIISVLAIAGSGYLLYARITNRNGKDPERQLFQITTNFLEKLVGVYKSTKKKFTSGSSKSVVCQ